MKINPGMIISLLLAVVFVVGGSQLVPWFAGSDQTPWPEAGIVLGWIVYRSGWAWWQRRNAPPA